MEEGNDGPLKLRTSASVNGGGTKGLPDNGLTDVGGNKEGNTRPQAVTLL